MVTMLQVQPKNMSFFLIATLLLLTAGAVITFFLSKKRHEYADLIGASIFILILILWVFVGRQLPIDYEFGSSQDLLGPPIWQFQIDRSVWQITLITIILATSVALAVDVGRRSTSYLSISGKQPVGVTPFAFLFTLTANLAIWSNSLVSILQSWSLLIIVWGIFYWLNNKDGNKIRAAVIHFIFLLVSLLFLWFANAANHETISNLSEIQNWSDGSLTWTLLASSVLLGLFLLHWWRPLEGQLPAAADVLVHLFPTMVGGWLLITISPMVGSGGSQKIIITSLALLGLLAGAFYSWSQIRNPRKLAPSLALAIVNMIAITSLWVNSEAARNELIATVLVLSGFFLFNAWLGQRPGWQRLAALIFVAALAGLPLTLSFGPRIQLFQIWLEGGQIFLAVVVSLLLAVNIGVAILIVQGKDEPDTQRPPPRQVHIQFGAVLFILALGLINFNHLDKLLDNWISPLFILISLVGGFLLSHYSQRTHDVEEAIRKAVPVKQLPLSRVWQWITRFLENVESIIHEGAAILEGEGGMLWLVVLLIILWLARISQ